MRKSYWVSGIIALAVTVSTLGIYHSLTQGSEGHTIKIEHVNSTPSSKALYSLNESGEVVPLDFVAVSEKVRNAVVHIKSTRRATSSNQGRQFRESPFGDDFFEQFFGPRNRPQNPNNRGGQPRVQLGQGSGVIISQNGYIVTNNHVVADADDLEVNLFDNRTFKAKVIGTDPTTDLAVLKIDETDLPNIEFVNSDEVRVGEWVLAVGNPFSLTSTVTAGIVSAKGRSINILRERFAVESFIQTDAAINPGNSGGALVDLNGGLIGINTAIASPTGAYSGYGFAIPANIVSKVVEDLIEFGVVQRGVLGVMIRSVDGNLQAQKDLSVNKGAYVDSLLANSAAKAAGIQSGDVILEVNGQAVNSTPELQEAIAQKRPGDVVEITVDRNGRTKTFDVTLNNRKGNTQIVATEDKAISDVLGAQLETVDEETAKSLDILGGVKVTNLTNGKLRKHTQMEEGFIITKVDGQSVQSVDELTKILDGKRGGVMLEGVYEDAPGSYYYAFGMN